MEKHGYTVTFGCEECVYVAIKKSKLGLHKATVHKMGEIDYSVNNVLTKGKLKTHVHIVHSTN